MEYADRRGGVVPLASLRLIPVGVPYSSLEGYREGPTSPPPTLLDEQETWIRPYAACTDDDRRRFWEEIDDYPDATPPVAVATY